MLYNEHIINLCCTRNRKCKLLCSKWWCAGPSTLILRLEAGQLSMTSVPGANLVGKTGGLLGTYDDNTSNDLTLANGTVLPADSSPETIYYTFGESCECLFACSGFNSFYYCNSFLHISTWPFRARVVKVRIETKSRFIILLRWFY
jgi:hypothetical protein